MGGCVCGAEMASPLRSRGVPWGEGSHGVWGRGPMGCEGESDMLVSSPREISCMRAPAFLNV